MITVKRIKLYKMNIHERSVLIEIGKKNHDCFDIL